MVGTDRRRVGSADFIFNPEACWNSHWRPATLLAVKRRVRTLDPVAATRRVGMIMDQTDPGRIAALLDDFNEIE